MYVYLIRDSDDGTVEKIYTEEVFKQVYKQYIRNPPLYKNQDNWDKYTYVVRWELNTENSEAVYPEDIKTLIED